MAQMTGAISPKALKIEYGATSTTTGFTDMSGYAAAVEVGGGERKTGEAYTYDGEYPLVTTGKMNPTTLTLRALYAKDTSAPYKFFRDYFASNSTVYIRWSPEGGGTSAKQFVATGNVFQAPPVAGPSDQATPILFEAKVTVTGAIIEQTVA